jgi:hypothetical protein
MLGEMANTILRPELLNNQLEWLFGGVCLIVLVIMIVLALMVCVWLYKDAESRGMSGVLWVILLIVGSFFAFGWIIILIIYLVVRKPKVMAPPPYPMAPPPAYAGVPPPAYGAPPPAYAPPPPPPGAAPAGPNCRYCGAPVPPGSMVCPRCGGRL